MPTSRVKLKVQYNPTDSDNWKRVTSTPISGDIGMAARFPLMSQ